PDEKEKSKITVEELQIKKAKKKKKKKHKEGEKHKLVKMYHRSCQTACGGLLLLPPSSPCPASSGLHSSSSSPFKSPLPVSPQSVSKNSHLPPSSAPPPVSKSVSNCVQPSPARQPPPSPYPGTGGLEFAPYIHIESQPNGGALVAHAYASQLGSLSPAQRERFAREFVTLSFSEDSSQAAHYVMGIVHGEAAYLPDFLEYFSTGFSSAPVKMEILGKKDIETTTMANFYSQVKRTYSNGTYRAGAMRQISLVGAVDEEVGDYFPGFLSMLAQSPFLKARLLLLCLTLPWGTLSSLEEMDPAQSDDGPIMWVRPGEQMIPVADIPKSPFKRKRSTNEVKNLLQSLPRTSEPREMLFEDRTRAHADHIGQGFERRTTAAVGVLKPVRAGDGYGAKASSGPGASSRHQRRGVFPRHRFHPRGSEAAAGPARTSAVPGLTRNADPLHDIPQTFPPHRPGDAAPWWRPGELHYEAPPPEERRRVLLLTQPCCVSVVRAVGGRRQAEPAAPGGDPLRPHPPPPRRRLLHPSQRGAPVQDGVVRLQPGLARALEAVPPGPGAGPGKGGGGGGGGGGGVRCRKQDFASCPGGGESCSRSAPPLSGLQQEQEHRGRRG
ncbi:unnamed protein product, partial [Tetraodon nigroviridis]